METRILIVDDEKAIRDFLYEALTRLGGFSVELAENGEEALKKIEKENFDLVLTDMKMPKMDGLQLITEIAKFKPETLMVLLTGHGSIDSALEAMKRGASDYLSKPINLDELLVRLRKVLDERQRFISLKDYATELEKANQELRKIDEMKSEFVSVASHELRTPLSAIKNAVQLMLQGRTGEINENQTKFLSMAERNINRLTSILNSLLDLSKIESGKIEMKFEELDLKSSIEFILSSLKPQTDGKSIQFKMEIPEKLPSVYGDREKVEQILTNLVGNAIKFTPEGGRIGVNCSVTDDSQPKLMVEFWDTGIGIDPATLERIGTRFYRADQVRSREGAGLGLSIVKAICDAHQGRLGIESQLGKGTCVSIAFPI